jgi:hypothetical protein
MMEEAILPRGKLHTDLPLVLTSPFTSMVLEAVCISLVAALVKTRADPA